MRTRNWSIRAKIISLLMVPLTTLVVMWGLATAVTLSPGLDLLDAQSDLDNIAHPGQALVAQLQAERKASMVYLAGGNEKARPLLQQRARTDEALKTFRERATSADVIDATTPAARDRLSGLLTQVDGLATLRGEVDRAAINGDAAFSTYTTIIAAGYQLFAALVRVSDPTIATESVALVNLARSREALSQEDAVLSAALAAGGLHTGDVLRATQLIGAQRYMFSQTMPSLHDVDRAEYQALFASPEYAQLRALEEAAMSAVDGRAPASLTAAAWQAAYQQVAAQLEQLELRVADRVVQRSLPSTLSIFGRIAVTGLLGLITIIVTIILTVRIGRSLLQRLAGLRQAALELAVDRLPRVVARLRQGEAVDVASEAPALPYGGDEIGQVGHAFNELQRTAVTSAIDEANVRRGLNEVFLNIARRSQTLLHRQLSILDKMERRADDPAELEDLFRVDHLATRMRRHAEDLVILAGAAPGRGWRNPVPVVDVLRGAVSEVEDYARVSVRPMPEIALLGRAVGDIIHLLAELIENATSFSPPHTRVNVGGELVGHGFAIEIEDRGLGMSREQLAECNARLANPPEFDPASSAQLGLFVVARLAARHAVKVQLRSSPYGGITAVALIPDDLVVGAGAQHDSIAALPAGPGEHGNGRPRYREIATAARPAIAPAPAPAPGPGRAVSVPVQARRDGENSAQRQEGTSPAEREPERIAGRAAVKGAKQPPRHARQEIIEADASTGDGLPRRVRQTSLAPQLRDDAPSPGVSTSGDIATPGPGTRSPEQLRAMMTSFQSGTNRGRRDADAADKSDQAAPASGRDAQ